MRVLGIDYGDSRIGVAVSDPLGWTANGLETVQAKQRFHQAVEQIAALCDQYQVQTVVVGYPKNMDGSLGERIEKTEGFIGALCKLRPYLEIVRWDERLTSVASQRILRETGTDLRRRKKGIVDKLAAELILQGYLDQKRV